MQNLALSALARNYFGGDLRYIMKTRIQIYWKFYNPKKGKFSVKKSDIFHISAQNIDCGYPLELPQRGGSNVYLQSMF